MWISHQTGNSTTIEFYPMSPPGSLVELVCIILYVTLTILLEAVKQANHVIVIMKTTVSLSQETMSRLLFEPVLLIWFISHGCYLNNVLPMEGWGHLYLYLWLKYESGLAIELFSKYNKKPRANASRAASDKGHTVNFLHCGYASDLSVGEIHYQKNFLTIFIFTFSFNLP